MRLIFYNALVGFGLFMCWGADQSQSLSLFDGKTFNGWEGNLKSWRIENGAIVGGALQKEIPQNEFLCTQRKFTNFVLRLKFKLLGERPNAGVQFRSRRVASSHEVSGYQADLVGGFWGSLYDESRRNKMLATSDSKRVNVVVKPNDWNECTIRCEGKRIRIWINDDRTVEYIEADGSIEQDGVIGLQIHGGRPSEAWYKDIRIQELPEEVDSNP